LLQGTGEIYGTELAIGHKYTFSGIKAAIYTWHGATLECRGKPTVEYTAEETPMTAYTNLHFALERLRQEADARIPQSNPTNRPNNSGTHTNNVGGPRVMILGPDDAGKTSLIKLLTGYAIRHRRSPCVVNLD